MGKQAQETENADDPMAKLEAKQAQEKKKRMDELYGDVVGQT